MKRAKKQKPMLTPLAKKLTIVLVTLVLFSLFYMALQSQPIVYEDDPPMVNTYDR